MPARIVPFVALLSAACAPAPQPCACAAQPVAAAMASQAVVEAEPDTCQITEIFAAAESPNVEAPAAPVAADPSADSVSARVASMLDQGKAHGSLSALFDADEALAPVRKVERLQEDARPDRRRGQARALQGPSAGPVHSARAPSNRRAVTAGTSDLSLGTKVRRGLTADEIRDVAESSMGQVRSCYERALKSMPSLRGRMVVSWRIEKDGEVTRTKTVQDELGDPSLTSCVLGVVSDWSFPESEKAMAVSFPFVLTPG